jgi:hypothetical protein
VDLMLLFLGFPFPLFLFIFEFGVIHDPADRRADIGRDLNQVEPRVPGGARRLANINYAKLLSVFAYEANAV